MDLYQKKSNWKVLLGVIGTGMLIITLIYSNYLANQLRLSDQKNTLIYAEALADILNNKDLNADQFLQDTIVRSFTLPVIFEDEQGLYIGENHGIEKDTNSEYLSELVERFLEEGRIPINGSGYVSKVYVFESKLLNYIRYYPLVQVLLVACFIAFGYYLFSSSRKGEQNRVWAGMAKETAHQLGTPISAILAWIEHLKISDGINTEQLEIIDELSNDVNRLELIADRFSKIGSAPKLEKINIDEEMAICVDYMKRRASKRINFIVDSVNENEDVRINRHLFDWVIENLYRNALDAMGAEGSLETKIYRNNEYVCIDISDSGKGISSSNYKRVFEPGFSTKQRGWGLGLSLAKRIIENYHSGKIFVKTSKINEGTTFSIQLPKA